MKTVIMNVTRPVSPTQSHKQGETVTISDDLADYYLSIGAARYATIQQTDARLKRYASDGKVAAVVAPGGEIAGPGISTDANGNTVLTGEDGKGIPFNKDIRPRLQSIHDVGLGEPLFELSLPSPYGVGTATPGGKYEFAYGTPVYSAKGFNGYKFWMAAAPYPTQGVDLAGLVPYKYENPCILVSNDGEKWEVPPGLVNPIATSIGLADANSYYADPYITFNADFTKLYLMFMHTNRTGAIKSSLMVTESSDGITWTTPVSVFDSTVTTFTANSPSLFWNGNGWTVLCVDTRDGTGTFTIQKMTTTSATPYTGWSAFSAVTCVHPLSRNWWHSYFVPLADGGVIGMIQDGGSGGGAVYAVQSNDGGNTFSVSQWSSHNSAAPGGQWYRPSLCLVSDGVSQSLIGYFTRIGPLQQQGFFVQKAKLVMGETNRKLINAILEDLINRQVATPGGILTNVLSAWDSFNRTDSATALGTSDSGLVWTNAVGTFGIGANRAYPTTASGGNSIATINPGVQNFEYSVVIETLGTQFYLVFNYIDSANFFRFGWSGTQAKLQKVVGGAIVVDKTPLLTIASGDRLTVQRNGKYITLFQNGRPIDTYADSGFAHITTVGLQASGASATYVGQMYMKPL